MKRLCFLCGLVLSLLIACQRNSHSECDKVLSDKVVPLRIDKPYYVDKFSNLFSEVHYVALEETRNSIVGTVSRLEVTNDGDFIVFDARAGAVFRFAPNGRFLNNIGFRGAGESEYVLPEDMQYDSFSNQVLVWDNGKRAILCYNVQGKLQSTIHLPWVIASFGVVDKEHLVCFMNNGEDVQVGERGTNYKVVRRDGLIEKEFGEYGSDQVGFYPASDGVFRSQLGRCLCLPPYSSTLYEACADSLSPVVTFDLLGQAVPREWMNGRFADFYEKLKKHPELVEIVCVYETSQYYVLKLSRDRVAMLCMVEKDTGAIRSLSVNVINDMYGLVGNVVLAYASADKLYFKIEPWEFDAMNSFLQNVPERVGVKAHLMSQREALYERKARFYGSESAKAYVDSLASSQFHYVPGERELVEEMSKKDNPIIQICTLK